MSLKAFHFFFIVVSVLLSAYFGGWCIQNYNESHSIALLAGGIASFAVTIGLSFYLFWFLRKLRQIPFLVLAVGLAMGWANTSQACAVCFGNPNSPLVKSAGIGVFFLLGVIGSILLSVAGTMVFWTRRARHLDTLPL